MEHIKDHVIDTYRELPGLLSISVIKNPYSYNPLIDGLDMLVLLVTDTDAASNAAQHVQLDNDRVAIRSVDRKALNRWITSGENRNIIEWIVRGEILLDREGYMANVREELLQFPESKREQKRFIEFAGFLRTYLQAKQDLSDGNLLDAYSHILTALHHWAHIALIEEGRHPELTVWKQLRRVHPGIYKLYEELTASPETLEQRVQLVMLACEFSVMSKMKECCSLLLSLMSTREMPWSIGELQTHPLIDELQVDVSLVVQKLVKRSYLSEVAVMDDPKDAVAIELKYRIANHS
ncbi:nucleotidyltransferase-like protein [Paenibacillus soyae]|uniref:Nucleotidyltransferase-like protein n=1 Tax=Paenibacillus soyae TaxID=2969249 RepID=A0A9X2N2D8_9BACL|nr:nucleotidyltransferase-like protein [Paenibacillus soyae]